MGNQSIMRKVCLILITILGLSNAQAQKFIGLGDTIVVYIDNRVEIKLSVSDYSTFNDDHETNKLLVNFQSILPDITSRLDPDGPDKVTFNGDDKLVVESGDLQYQFILSDNEMRDTGFRDVAILTAENAKVIITTSDLSILSDLQVQKCIQDVILQLPPRQYHSRTLFYECKEGSVTSLDDLNRTNAHIDAIELTAGTGAGLIKSNWVADLSAEIGLKINRKGVLRHNPYLSTNLVFDFDTGGGMNVNSFLNLGFRWNMDMKSDKPDWLGVEVGYLYHQEGDLFGENTFKLGLNWSLVKGRSVYVSPQLYFTDNFNTIFPGVRIGIGL